MYSGVIVRCILAASTLQGGKEAAKAVLAAVAAHREEFEFTSHCSGPNMDATPNDIIARLETYSGLKLAGAFAIPDLDREIKWHCKYARQNGIHVSPTFMIDGLVRPDMSSGDTVSDWVSRILSREEDVSSAATPARRIAGDAALEAAFAVPGERVGLYVDAKPQKPLGLRPPCA